MIIRFVLAAFAALGIFAQQAAAAPAGARAGRQPDRVAASDSAAARAARVERMFRLADRNRDNALSRAEYMRWYKVAARRRGPLTWRKHAAQLFRQLDVGQKGRLTKADFARDPAFRRTRPGWTRAVMSAMSAESGAGRAAEPAPEPAGP